MIRRNDENDKKKFRKIQHRRFEKFIEGNSLATGRIKLVYK